MVQAAAVVPAKARERLDIEWMDDDGGQIYSIDGPDDDSGRSILLMVHFLYQTLEMIFRVPFQGLLCFRVS